MLAYRHAFHAGNHADVLKHLVLMLVLKHLNAKPKAETTFFIYDKSLAAIEQTLNRHTIDYRRAKTWTTDAPYRETRAKVERRVAEGCVTVEMEAAALFAVARFRDVPLGMMFMTSDNLSGDQWDGSGFAAHLDTRELLLRLACETVLAL